MEEKNAERVLKEYGELIRLEELLKGINNKWTNLQKALYVYIQLEKKLDNIKSREIATIYYAIMKILEIPCNIVNGVEENCWNEIEIDGQYYPLDLSLDCLFFHSKESQGNIGICNFLSDKDFYNRTEHKTKDKENKTKIMDSKIVEKALYDVLNETKQKKRETVVKPKIQLKSKELEQLYEDIDEKTITEDNAKKVEKLKISLTDRDTSELKKDMDQIAEFYPELFKNIEIEHSKNSTETVNFQEVVDTIYESRKKYIKVHDVKFPMNITISSDSQEDFDLDFSNAPNISYDDKPTNATEYSQSITIKNTGTTTLDFPKIMDKMSKNIEAITIDGFHVKNDDLEHSDLKKICFKSILTTFDNGITGLGGTGEVVVENISDAEFDRFMTNIFLSNPNIFNLTISGQNLSSRNIFDELAINRNLVSINIFNSKLDSLNGLDKFINRLVFLGLSHNRLRISDIEKLNEFKQRCKNLIVNMDYRGNVNDEIRNNISLISSETIDFIRNYIMQSGEAGRIWVRNYQNECRDSKNIIGFLYSYRAENIPYYIRDAKIMRENLKLTSNPMMLESDDEINTINFLEPHLQNGKLLLSIPQVELLINSGKSIPQHIIIKVQSIKDLDSNQLKSLVARANNRFTIDGVEIFDKNNSYTAIHPYSVSEYAYLRDMMDMIVEGIDLNEPDIDRFTTVYLRLASSIIYDIPAASSGNRAELLYNWKVDNSCRNLLNGIVDGKCVCAGYADILRNALDLVGIDSRYLCGRVNANNSNSGHAWNQVKIDGKWYFTDLTWDRQKDDTQGHRRNFDNMLLGSINFLKNHQWTRNHTIENAETDDYDRIKLMDAISRAKKRTFDFTNSGKAINIPEEPNTPLQMDNKMISEEFKRRSNDMYAKYYGDKKYEEEYRVRSARYRKNEIEVNNGTIVYRTISDYVERLEDEQFLLLDKYKECLERMTKYEAGVRNVYTGTPDQKEMQYRKDKEYVETRNYTFNQHEFTQKDLATLGKYGEKMPYIPKQPGTLKTIGRAIGNTSIFFRNTITAPIHRVIGRLVAQPIHRLITRGKDASPYKNNIYHRLVARRDYFLDEAQRRDQIETQNRISNATDPTKIKPVNHFIRNGISCRFNAIFKAKKGNEAVLRAGLSDIKENIKQQYSQNILQKTLETQIREYAAQINMLSSMLAQTPNASNSKEVHKVIRERTSKMQTLEQQLHNLSTVGMDQTDAISSKQHAIASKEVNTFRTTVIKGVAKGLAVRFVGPKIEKWLLERGKQVNTTQAPGTTIRQGRKEWVPTTYKDVKTPIYEQKLDFGKNMQDIISKNKGADIKGFYSVYGGEKGEAIYNLTGNEKITAVFQSVGKGGSGLSDKFGLQAPLLTDKTFSNALLDQSGILKQGTSIDKLLSELQIGNTDLSSLENVYVSIDDCYWTKLSNLVEPLKVNTKVGEQVSKVIDQAGHFEWIKNTAKEVNTVAKEVINPTVQTGVNIGKNIGKGTIVVDSVIDIVENVRPTRTEVESNKPKPRKYDYDDRDIGNIPTSKKEYDESR